MIENMSGFVCPNCGAKVDIFKAGGGEKMSKELGVPFLGGIPIDPSICEDSDRGSPFIVGHPNSPATEAFTGIVEKIRYFLKQRTRCLSISTEKEVN